MTLCLKFVLEQIYNIHLVYLSFYLSKTTFAGQTWVLQSTIWFINPYIFCRMCHKLCRCSHTTTPLSVWKVVDNGVNIRLRSHSLIGCNNAHYTSCLENVYPYCGAVKDNNHNWIKIRFTINLILYPPPSHKLYCHHVISFVLTCILSDMPSLSDNSSARFLVPSTFLRVVCASSRVDAWGLDTLVTAEMGQCIRKYTAPSTDTVTESLVRICRSKVVSVSVLTKKSIPEIETDARNNAMFALHSVIKRFSNLILKYPSTACFPSLLALITPHEVWLAQSWAGRNQ